MSSSPQNKLMGPKGGKDVRIEDAKSQNKPFNPIGVYSPRLAGDVDIWPNDYTGRSARGVKRPFFSRYEQTLQIRQPPVSVRTCRVSLEDVKLLSGALPKVAGEMALSVLAYNLTRVMNIVGIKPLIAAIAA
jgi:hypothetical protein